MSFCTASGKSVKVSEEALAKAREIFDELDDSLENQQKPINISTDKGQSPILRNRRSLGSSSETTASRPFRSPVCSTPRKKFRSTEDIDCESATEISFQTPTKSGVYLNRSNYKKLNSSTPIHSDSSIFCTPERTIKARGSSENVTPIKLLTPYCRSWRLCVKVISLDKLRQYRGMDVFSFQAVDDGGTEIRISAFKDLAHSIANMIRLHGMYYIEHGMVKFTNKRYKNQHDMEIILNSTKELIQCSDRPEIPSPKLLFKFVRINQLKSHVNSEIDIMGIIINIGDSKRINGKAGETITKREIQIVDDGNVSVIVTLWNERAEAYEESLLNSAFVASGLLVRSYHGYITLSAHTHTKILINPDISQVNPLKTWYEDYENIDYSFVSISTDPLESYHDHYWIGQVVCSTTKLTYFTVTAGCATTGCRKKLIETVDGLKCPKCALLCPYFKHFFTLSIEIGDFTGTHWVNLFDEIVEKLYGDSADEFAKIQKYNPERFQKNLKAPLFKMYSFRITTRLERITLSNRNSCTSDSASKTLPSNTTGSNRQKAANHRPKWCVTGLVPLAYDSYLKFLEQSVSNYSVLKQCANRSSI